MITEHKIQTWSVFGSVLLHFHGVHRKSHFSLGLTVSCCKDAVLKRFSKGADDVETFVHESVTICTLTLAGRAPFPVLLPVVHFSTSSVDCPCPVRKTTFDVYWVLVHVLRLPSHIYFRHGLANQMIGDDYVLALMWHFRELLVALEYIP